MPMHGKYVADAGNGQRIGAYETEKQALDALAENEMYRFSEVPEAPFTTTWHEYVLKRVLRMAADNGWSVRRIKIDDGCYEIDGRDAEGRRIEVTVSPASLQVIEIEYKDDDERAQRDRSGNPGGGDDD